MAAAKVNERNGGIDGPTNPLVTPLLTDLYQFTMAYAYWKAGKHEERAVFDLYFRKNPFGGEYTVFAGLEECIKLIANFRIAEDEIAFIRASLPPSCEDGFYDYLRGMDCSNVEIHSISEGYVVFPNVPLMRVEGPIAVVQLLETPLLNLINYASLVATNASRHRFVAGKSKLLLEFGLRRAQGPDGGIGASKYSYMGGFDATSNVAAGKLFGIPLRGTHSHAFVSSFMEAIEALVEEALPMSTPRRNSSKRTRAAEVHNLSEKRRRSRINEKMKSLQNLIPNSNKTDKASVLDEAIEYLKQLQLQVQMLTMRNGLSLYPVSLPWMPRRDQISQMRMGIHPGNGPLNVNMESEHPLNQDNLSNPLFNLLDNSPMHASAADFSTMMGSKTSFELASIPTQLGPLQFSRSSKGMCRDEDLPFHQVNGDSSGTGFRDYTEGVKAYSIPSDTRPSDLNENPLEACFIGGEQLEGMQQNLGCNRNLSPQFNGQIGGRTSNDDIKIESNGL